MRRNTNLLVGKRDSDFPNKSKQKRIFYTPKSESLFFNTVAFHHDEIRNYLFWLKPQDPNIKLNNFFIKTTGIFEADNNYKISLKDRKYRIMKKIEYLLNNY